MSGLVGSYGERHGRTFGGWLVVFALGYAFFHHEGKLFAGLGDVGSLADGTTRWADWVDLLTPYVVTGAAAGALRAGGASPRRLDLVLVRRDPLHPGSRHPSRRATASTTRCRATRSRRTSGTSTSVTTSGTSASTCWWSRSRWPWPTGACAADRWPTCSRCWSASPASPTRSRARRRGWASGRVSSSWCGAC